MQSKFTDKVSRYIARHQLFTDDGKYLVALSGGADSVALLRIMLTLGYKVEAAHCNFHLRGEESDRDEQFVMRLCQSFDVPLHLAHFDTVGYAELHKVSIEMAARDLRYNYFNQLVRDIEAEAVCVAHHRDDSVETVLINLVRGTGIHGLTGIHPRNGNILRPLLCVSRQDIEDYLKELGQPYVTDSTNLVDDVVRNKIRLNILPLLCDINPSVAESIQQTAERVAESAKVFDAAISDAIDRVCVTERTSQGVKVSLPQLLSEISSESVVFAILRDYGFSSQTIQQICSNLDSPSGRIYASPTHELLFDREQIIITEIKQAARPLIIPECGVYVHENMKWRVQSTDVDDSFAPSRIKSLVTLDASAVKFPLTVRPVQNGDRFVPFGMRGSKLVSDYLTDLKKNLFEKREQLVVVDAEDKIVWLVNERTDNRCRTGHSTTKVISISFEQP